VEQIAIRNTQAYIQKMSATGEAHLAQAVVQQQREVIHARRRAIHPHQRVIQTTADISNGKYFTQATGPFTH
jgi:hypothetical protein